MSGIISITSRRLPRNVLSLGMQAARSQEVSITLVFYQFYATGVLFCCNRNGCGLLGLGGVVDTTWAIAKIVVLK